MAAIIYLNIKSSEHNKTVEMWKLNVSEIYVWDDSESS